MRIKTTIAATAVVVAVPLAGPAIVDAAGTHAAAATPSAGAAAVFREFEGTVVSVNRSARTFRLRDSERGTVTIVTTRATRYERLAGFAAVRAGLSRIETDVRRSNGRWIAREVERSGGGGAHGDDRDDDDHGGRRGDDRDDDHRGHDRGDDDHRGRGHGGDDDRD